MVASILPYFMGYAGLGYLILSLILGGMFLCFAVKMKKNIQKYGRQTFGFSILYLFVLFSLMLIDHVWSWFLARDRWWCPQGDSNSHVPKDNRFWVCRVYQFHHRGTVINFLLHNIYVPSTKISSLVYIFIIASKVCIPELHLKTDLFIPI